MVTTTRLTVGQALVRFLAAQRTERDGVEHRLIEGCFGIFGHGNVAGVGQALLQEGFPYLQGRNEQAMVHAAAAFARTRNRLSTLACTSSVGPGATNMENTGAALLPRSTRLPVLLPLPGDVFATRVADPVLQQLEYPGGLDVSVNDAKFRPVSRFFDRVWRPGAAAVGAARRDAGADRPGRKPARSPSRCRRTSRPRPGTGRMSCSANGSGTSSGHRPTRPRWPERSR